MNHHQSSVNNLGKNTSRLTAWPSDCLTSVQRVARYSKVSVCSINPSSFKVFQHAPMQTFVKQDFRSFTPDFTHVIVSLSLHYCLHVCYNYTCYFERKFNKWTVNTLYHWSVVNIVGFGIRDATPGGCCWRDWAQKTREI